MLRRQTLNCAHHIPRIPNAEIDKPITKVIAIDDDAEQRVGDFLVPPHVDHQAVCKLDLQDIAKPINMGWIVEQATSDLCSGRKLTEMHGLHLLPLSF